MLHWCIIDLLASCQTYTTDRRCPDSGASATALLCGVKARVGTVGVTDQVPRGDCTKVKANKVKSIITIGNEQGGRLNHQKS